MPSRGLVHLDPDTAMNPHSLRAALHAAGAVVHATDLVLQGEAHNAFCCVRPPGHHAERARAMGFCFFNNVAVGAAHALEQHGLERVVAACHKFPGPVWEVGKRLTASQFKKGEAAAAPVATTMNRQDAKQS